MRIHLFIHVLSQDVHTAVLTVFLLSCLSLQSGCQTFRPENQSSPPHQAQFMDAWKTYLHCRSSDTPDEIRFDVYQLKDLANKLSSPYQPPRVLPSRIRSLFTPLPSRLAVDPGEMVVACALHGAQVAESAGRSDLSRELFSSVMPDHNAADSEKDGSDKGARERKPVLD